MRTTILLVATASLACATVPTSGPDPALAATTYDCEAPWVESERPAVAPAVAACVAGPPADVAPCLDGLGRGIAHPDTVGCEVRDRGASAAAAVAAGTASEREKQVAVNVRTWIRDGERSFR